MAATKKAPTQKAQIQSLKPLAIAATALFLFSGPRALAVAAKVLIFILLVSSYDLLLGYTGIVSFAHTMFFGIGAYGVAIDSAKFAPTWDSILLWIYKLSEPLGGFSQLFNLDRWLLWLGILFVLSVYYFPSGIVGHLQKKNKA